MKKCRTYEVFYKDEWNRKFSTLVQDTSREDAIAQLQADLNDFRNDGAFMVERAVFKGWSPDYRADTRDTMEKAKSGLPSAKVVCMQAYRESKALTECELLRRDLALI